MEKRLIILYLKRTSKFGKTRLFSILLIHFFQTSQVLIKKIEHKNVRKFCRHLQMLTERKSLLYQISPSVIKKKPQSLTFESMVKLILEKSKVIFQKHQRRLSCFCVAKKHV